MRVIGARRLKDGRVVRVRRNDGLRKLCECRADVWAKCPHPWHFSFTWRGQDYRLSLDRYVGRHVSSKTEAEKETDALRIAIRNGTFGKKPEPASICAPSVSTGTAFDAFGYQFLEDYSKARGKASWQDDAYRLGKLLAFLLPDGSRLGDKPLRDVAEGDIEAFLSHLVILARAAATRNHYVQLVKAMSKWAVRKRHRDTPFVTGDSDVIRRTKETQRHRRLDPDEEAKIIGAAGPHLQHLIIAALESCCRQGELLTLQWRDVSLTRGEVVLRAEKTKDREHRTIPISTRLRTVLEMLQNDVNGEPSPPMAYVFGDEVGARIGSIKRAWQTTVLRASGHKPTWIWKKKLGPNDKGTTKLSPESQAAYRAVDLHFHDLRHEAASRLLEAGWPLHHVQQMLGHASITQTSTYLNATLRGLHQSMRDMEETRAACKPVAKPPALAPRPNCRQTPVHDGNPLIH